VDLDAETIAGQVMVVVLARKATGGSVSAFAARVWRVQAVEAWEFSVQQWPGVAARVVARVKASSKGSAREYVRQANQDPATANLSRPSTASVQQCLAAGCASSKCDNDTARR
jgi:hypothetical protein